MSRLLAAANGTEYFLASLVALPLIERTGRRNLMLFGAFGMMASMAILGGTVSTGGVAENGAPILDQRFGITATVFLFVFNSFFAIGRSNDTVQRDSFCVQNTDLVMDRLARNDLALPRRNHQPPHPHPSQRPIHLLQLALQLPHRHDHPSRLRQPRLQDLRHVRHLQRRHHPLCLALLP
jgi:hypothetical protein